VGDDREPHHGDRPRLRGALSPHHLRLVIGPERAEHAAVVAVHLAEVAVAILAADHPILLLHGVSPGSSWFVKDHSAAIDGAGWNWAASVEPAIAVVEERPPEIAMDTASK